MSETRPDSAAETEAAPESTASRSDAQHAAHPRNRLSRRGWTVLISGVLVVVFVLLGAFVPVPYVALGPGPTYDTLGDVNGAPVVQVDGQQAYPTSGELRMTTVSLNTDLTLFGSMALWASGRYAIAPREDYFPPGESNEQVEEKNRRQFQDSQSDAETAALRKLGHPVKVLVKEVVEGGPATGVLVPGDRLISINGKTIAQEEDVRVALDGTAAGQTISLVAQRPGEAERTESLTLAQHPQPPAGFTGGFIGIQPIDRADVPFDVKIQLEDVGGPSAGLIFAMAIVDRLTPGEMVAGKHIAGTGEITAQGEVGPIGGISFKVVAAREAGATAFLTPAANCSEAVSAAPDGLELIKVTTLDSALTAVADLQAGKPVPTCSAP